MERIGKILAIAFVVILALCTGLYFHVDLALAISIKQKGGPDWQGVWRLITHAGQAEYAFIFAGLMILAGHIGARVKPGEAIYAVRSAGHYLLMSLLVAGAIIVCAKPLIGRLRPRVFSNEGVYGFDPLSFDYGRLSFPSGHAQSAWTFAICAAIILPPLLRIILARRSAVRISYTITATLIAFATLIALSRVALTVHWLSDVVMGSFLGAAVPLLLRDRFFPQAKISRSANDGC